MMLKYLLKLLPFVVFFALSGVSSAQAPCTSSPTIISQNSQGQSSTVVCSGDPLILSSSITLTDCPDCTYQWSDGASGPSTFAFAAGSYTVTVTDNAFGGCVGISNVLVISSNNLSKPLFTEDSFNICNGQPVTIEVANPCVDCYYQWFNTTTSVNNAGINASSYQATTPNQYYVRVTYPTTESFESTYNSGYTANNDFVSGSDYFDLIGDGTITDPATFPSYTGFDGTNYWAAGGNTSSPSRFVTFENIDISGLSTIEVSGLFASEGTNTVENNDYLRIYAEVDGGAPILIGAFYGSGVTDKFEIDADLDGNGDGVASLFLAATNFTFAVPATGNVMDITIEVFTSFDEDIAFDNIRITNASPCYKDSDFITVGTASVSQPPILATSYGLCDSSSSVLSTIDCSDCIYEWQFYDYLPQEKLVISGVFDATREGGQPKGVEIYAVGNIPDLSAYGLQKNNNANQTVNTTPTSVGFNLPPVSLQAGDFYYITDDAAAFQSFFGFAANYEAPPSTLNVDGNDPILLYYTSDGGSNYELVDAYGQQECFGACPASPPITCCELFNHDFAYNDGWASRIPNTPPASTYNNDHWVHGKQEFRIDIASVNNTYYGVNSMPIGTFTTTPIPPVELVITGVFSDTSNGARVSGIELYCRSNIDDWTQYQLGIAKDGNGVTTPLYSFVNPGSPILAGEYIYLTDNASQLTSFFGSTPANIISNSYFANLDGDDAVFLAKNSNLVDVFGDTLHNGTITWDYSNGWAQSSDNRNISNNFSTSDWTINRGAWLNTTLNSQAGANRFNLGTVDFETVYSSVMISGVFDADLTTNGNKTQGIELYILEDAVDLSNYSIEIFDNAGSSQGVYGLSGIVNTGYYYLEDNTGGTGFNTFFTPTISNGNDALFDNLDGIEAVALMLNSNIVDVFGNKTSSSNSVRWSYKDGWAYRNSNELPNIGIFDSTSSWTYANEAYQPTNDLFGATTLPTFSNPLTTNAPYVGTGRMPIQSYFNSLPGTNLNILFSEDSSAITTNVVGDYIVQVQFPNGCIAKTDTLSLDTIIFEPRIEALMPTTSFPIIPDADDSTSIDTSYLCLGASVELYMTGSYQVPPNWSYQWSRNGIDILGATGYIYSATSPGLYKVLVVDDNGCTSYSNTIVVVNSTNGSNPAIDATSLYLCNSDAQSILSTSPFNNVSYAWKTETGSVPSFGDASLSTFTVTGGNAGGYYVEITDNESKCVYNSPFIIVSDTTYPAPTLLTNDNTVCSEDPVLLSSSIICAGCTYSYILNYNSAPIDTVFSAQSNLQIDTSGFFQLYIVYDNGCNTEMSNTIEATFETVQAIAEPPNQNALSICNSQPLALHALPSLPLADSIVLQEDFDHVFTFQGAPVSVLSPAWSESLLSNSFFMNQFLGVNLIDLTASYVHSSAPTATTIFDTLFSPQLIFGNAINNPTVTFDYQMIVDSGPAPTIQVLYKSAVSNPWILAQSFSDTGIHTLNTVNLNSATQDFYIAFRVSFEAYASPTRKIIALDNINVTGNQSAGPFCADCDYVFLRDGVPMQITQPLDSQTISVAGSYQVIVTNADNCPDTSAALVYQDVSVTTSIAQSTQKICGPGSSVVMSVDDCAGCDFQWYFGTTPLSNSDTSAYAATGFGSGGRYFVDVTKDGCVASDTVDIVEVSEVLSLTIEIDSVVSSSATICNGSDVLLYDTCETCIIGGQYQYQWFLNGDTIVGASFESYQVDSAGQYSVAIVDTNNCPATSNTIVVTEFAEPTGFSLDFTPLGVAIPLTYGMLDLDSFLFPNILDTISSGSYSSLTANAAINGSMLDVFDAGPGQHFITFSYIDDNCEFSTTAVIEVLTGVDMSVTNTNPVSVPFEACLYDNLQITFTNFTFQPDTVRFVAGGGATIDIAVTPIISQTAGVWSGTINVQVPDGARTGKITLTNGVDTYESTNFYQIHNPSVAISIQSTTDPICSNLDSATFEGLPAGGYFSAHYVGLDTTSNPELMVAGTDTLDLTAVAGYMAGEVDVVMMYHYNPRFTNDSLCPQQVLDSLTVTVLDGQLDSVHYTPIANSQPIEDLEDLTLLTYPVSARYYAYSYSGTYVAINDLLPNTIAPTGAFVGEDSIQYQINNAGCTNFSDDAIDIWPAPTVLDSIPENQCSLGDTVFVYRNADSLKVFYRGAMIYADTLYRYRSIGTTSYPAAPASPLVDYDEQYNIMEFTSSNGGITTFNSNQGQEEYYFVPANVTAGSTTLNFKFKYERTATFYDTLFDTILSTENTEYYIAEVSKTIFIENPSNVQLNSLLQTDTIFCPVNQTTLLTGQPLGGQYYLDYDTIINNVFNPVSPAALQGTYRLTYVYEGQSCVDSAVTNILIPPTFSINLSLDTFCETSPDKDIYYDGYDPLNVTFLDTNSVQFYVKGIQSIPVFSPVNVFGNTGAPEDVPVVYEIADTFGCVESAASIFTIIPNPNIGTTFPTDTTVCENDPQMPIDLFIYEYDSTICNTLTSFGCGLFNPDSIDVSSATGGVIDQGGVNAIDQLFFYPANAGTGTHQIVYHFRDSNTCTSTRILTVNVLELPNVNMTLVNDVAIGTPFQFICEEDSIRLFGQPFETDVTRFGYGSFTTNGTSPTSFDPATQDFEPAVPGVLPSQVDEVIYYWFEDLLGCRDTSSHTFRIRNFTDTFKIQGLPDTICAYDNEFPITIDLISTTAPSLDSFGWFGSSYPQAFSQIDSFPTNTDSISFNPGNSGIEFADREVDLTFYIRDPSGSCFDQFDTSVIVQTLPNIYLSEFSATDLNEIDVPGSTLLNPQPDGYYHVCIDRPELQLIPYNFYGNYLPVQDILLIGAPIPLATYQDSAYNSVSGPNVDSIFFPGAIAYYFNPIMAGPGLDTIIHFYTNPNGCTSKDTTLIFVDDLPALSFTNLTAPDPVSGNYVFCEKDDSINISPSPSGVTALSLTFNGQPINTVPFVMNPQALADPAGLIQLDYALQYNYTGQVYADGGICADTIIDTISILPAPNLDWVSVPSSFCLTNDVPNFPLSATPYGGTFSDISFGIEGKPAILNDSLFNPFAQAGTRTIVYEYVDGNNCYDSIQYKIGIYSKPKLDFFINGGCQGLNIEFVADSFPYGFDTTSLSLDSISMVIWNYGDGTADTMTNFSNQWDIPSSNHTYSSNGIFSPSLTVVNQGVCDSVFTRRIVISPLFTPLDTVPYEEFFDGDPLLMGWMQESADTASDDGFVTDSLWQLGETIGNVINTQGNVGWTTGSYSTYSGGKSAWVYSPCFDLTQLDKPMIEMSVWRNSLSSIDGAVLQYHDNISNSWKVLGRYGKGINWYQDGYVVSAPGEQINVPIGWSGTSTGFENARYRLDNIDADLRNRNDVRFRVSFSSDSSTLAGTYDGFAFDSVRIGNRSRSVLVEHFSGTGYPGLETIEERLYETIFSNLYGRDVTLIQYFTDNYTPTTTYHDFNDVDNRQRELFYGVEDDNQVRVDGKDYVTFTSDLLEYPHPDSLPGSMKLEFLDIDMLEDAKFKIDFQFPGISHTNNQLSVDVKVEVLQDMPSNLYSLHVVITEDSLLTAANHEVQAVMRTMLPNNSGTSYAQPFAIGETMTVNQVWNFTAANHNLNALHAVAFMQNMVTKEVYQVAHTRDILSLNGPYIFADSTISVDNIKDAEGYEIVDLNLYPNPTEQQFNVSFSKALSEDHEWKLIDAVGRVLQQGIVQEGSTIMQVNTDKLSAGMYIFSINNDKVYVQRKVVVRKP